MKVKIKDIARVLNGSTPSTKCPKYYDGDILWITPKDLSDQKGKYIYAGERTITQEGYDSCSTEMIPKDNILMSSRAPIGLLAINKVDCCTNQGFKSLVVDKTKCSEEYLYYYLKYHIKEIEALGSGTTFKEVSKDSMEKYEIELPELSKQEKIVNILADLDEKIINNNAINAELESMAKTIYDYWFLQFEFPNEEGKPYKSSGGKMVWNEELKREIPEGWECKTIRDIENNIITGKTPSSKVPEYYNGDIPFITIGDIRGNMYVVSTEQTLSEEGAKTQNNKFIPEGSICVTCIATPGLVGFSVKDSQTNQQINSIVPKNKKNSNYLYFAINEYFEYASGAKTGNTFANMNKEDFSNILLLYNKEMVEKYFDITKDIFDKIKQSLLENEELASLRDFLLPMLMNGQVGFKNK